MLIAALAGAVALGAFALVFANRSTSTPSPAPAAATSKAVVALVDLNVGDQLSLANVVVADYPSSALPAAGLYYSDTKALIASAMYSTAKLPRGQLIQLTQLTQQAAVAQKLPPVQLADGNVGMSVPFDEGKDGAGFIQQDDYIDILVYVPPTVTVPPTLPVPAAEHYTFLGIHVLRVGDRAAQATGASAAAAPGGGTSMLLIEIGRQQAAAFALALDNNYPMRYLIRPHDQQNQQSLPNSGPVGVSNWPAVVSG